MTHVAFDPSGAWIATASADGTACLWDARTGALHVTYVGHAAHVLGLEFSPDGTRLATASEDGTARVWPVDPLEAARDLAPRSPTAGDRARMIE